MSLLILAGALLLVATAPLTAQDTGADSATPGVQGYAPGGPPAPTPRASERARADPSVVAGAIAVPRRSRAELQQAMMATQNDLRQAEARLSSASEHRSKARALVQHRRLEVREIAAKRKQADKEKRKGDTKVLAAEERAVERQRNLAERLEGVADADFDAAREASQVAVAQHQALDLERLLAQKRADRARGDGSNLVIRQLEEETLEAQKKYRRQASQLAQKEEELANKRLGLYKGSLEAKGPDAPIRVRLVDRSES
jgi:chromosome segregation ATPase